MNGGKGLLFEQSQVLQNVTMDQNCLQTCWVHWYAIMLLVGLARTILFISSIVSY